MLNQRENTHQIENINEPLQSVIDRCKEKSREAPIMLQYEKEYGELPKEQDASISILKHIGIASLYHRCTFDNFQGNEKLVQDIKSISGDNLSAVLRGNTGCGKTHLAVAILQDQKSYFCKFITVPNLLLKIRSSFNGGQGTETEEEIINSFVEYKTLVLDDLGAEKTSEFSITTLYLILDRRISEERQTIITTNLSQKEIEETFGARIASRLAGMINIKINMPDYRKKRG